MGAKHIFNVDFYSVHVSTYFTFNINESSYHVSPPPPFPDRCVVSYLFVQTSFFFFSSGTNLTTFTTTFKGIPALSIPRFLSFCFFFDSFPSPTSTLPSSQLPLSVCTIFSRWKTSFTSDNCVQASFRQLSREI